MNLNTALQTMAMSLGEINPKLLDTVYKERAKIYHPDKKGGDAIKFKELNEAKETISDYLTLKSVIVRTKKYSNAIVSICVPEPSITGSGSLQDPLIEGSYDYRLLNVDEKNIFKIIQPKKHEQANQTT